MTCRSGNRALQPALLLVLALAVCPALGAQAPRPGQAVVIDRIVAVVNDEAITARELDERTRFAMKQLAQQGTAPPPQFELPASQRPAAGACRSRVSWR